MSVRSPVAACTASASALLCAEVTAPRPFSSIAAKPAEVLAPDGAAASGPLITLAGARLGSAALIAPIAGRLMSVVLSDVDGVEVGLAGPVHDRGVGLEGPLGHDQVAHLLGHVDVGQPDVALGVGERVVRLVAQPALRAAERQGRDAHPATGFVGR